MDPMNPLPRATLDGQLVDYWLREAARLDALAAQARFGWQKRGLARKAARARGQAERSRVRESARAGTTEGASAELSQG
ncbi:hypothetical protein [Methylobacterium sp. J-076]|uniref:hypothetical protein n=1 Tax=Methylobacterium sp. J-076 TaxID=2836655 RepID=UPI001FBBE03E|nr:hypothetical protein [Methylobacterium sp. J-076]MCJ2015444.1 hypothetical protein [Methylobacterium sp. J-076]